ncbi:hypothetical protein Tco_0307641 [Tanacetum coccineum]
MFLLKSLTVVAPSQFAKNVVDLDDAPSDKMKLFWLTTWLLKRETCQKTHKVPPQASKVLDEPSDPLDIDSDPYIHESGGRLSKWAYQASLIRRIRAFWSRGQRLISSRIFYTKKLIRRMPLQDTAYWRLVSFVDLVFLDNVMNRRTLKLMSTLTKARAACDAIWERKREKDKAYAKLEVKCNDALQDLDKNPLVLDMCAEIETLQGQVNKLHGEYSRLVLEEKKWINYDQTLATLHSKAEGLEAKRERLKKSEAQLLQENNGLKSDKMGFLVARLVKTTLVHGRRIVFEEVADLKEPFELKKMPGYRPSLKKEFD